MSLTSVNYEELCLKEYQLYLQEKLQGYFRGNVEVQTEWNAMKEERHLNIYSPRIDLAVGPFAINRRCEGDYDNMLDDEKIKVLIETMINFSNENLMSIDDEFIDPVTFGDIVYQNSNARCFIAIEIENQVSRKHLMGGAINAGALGRIGILMPWSTDKFRAFVRLFRYMQYLKSAEKNNFNMKNLLILTKQQFNEAILKYNNS